MNAVVMRRPGQSSIVLGNLPGGALFLLVALHGGLAFADGAAYPPPASSMSTLKDEHRGAKLEVSAASLPRYDNTDGSNRSSRLDLSWLPPRRSALGLSLGMTSPAGYSAGHSFSAGGRNAGTTVDLGLRWRYTLDSNYRVDVIAWRRLMPADALTLVQLHEPSYGARVEMQIGSTPKNGFVADRGFLGLQLESGARVTLRRSGGKPMLYYRTKF